MTQSYTVRVAENQQGIMTFGLAGVYPGGGTTTCSVNIIELPGSVA